MNTLLDVVLPQSFPGWYSRERNKLNLNFVYSIFETYPQLHNHFVTIKYTTWKLKNQIIFTSIKWVLSLVFFRLAIETKDGSSEFNIFGVQDQIFDRSESAENYRINLVCARKINSVNMSKV